MVPREECRNLRGRVKEICEGLSGLPLDKVNLYRHAWGLLPLTELPSGLILTKPNPSTAKTPSQKGKPCCGQSSSRPLPNLISQGLNYGKALIKHQLDPGILSTEEIIKRINICESCSWFRTEDRRCAHPKCGCYIDTKATWKSENCPENKWVSSTKVCQEMSWAYGITTVPGRAGELFPRTLKSLAKAGFDKPRLFIDGAKDGRDYEKFGLEITTHWPNLRTAGNWVLSLYELYIRNPECDRYAIFQDDFVTSLNLRLYLDCCNYPSQGYWNLYTFPVNQNLCPEKKSYEGWYPSDQRGKGAVALVFNREAVCTLLSQRMLVDRPQDPKRGHKAIDGGIIDAFQKIGWTEYVHNPSLVQHTGLVSSMGNMRHPTASSFQGENFDLMSVIPNREIIDAKLNEWETEKSSLEKAMREDQERFEQAQTPADKAKYKAHVQRYQKKLILHLQDYSKRLNK